MDRLALRLALLAQRRRDHRDLLAADMISTLSARPGGRRGRRGALGRLRGRGARRWCRPRSACCGTRAAASVERPEQDRASRSAGGGRPSVGESSGVTALSTIWPPRCSTPRSSPCSGWSRSATCGPGWSPTRALAASLAIALPVCLLSDPGGMPERLAGGARRRRVPARGGADPSRRDGPRRREARRGARRLPGRAGARGDGGRLRGRVGRGLVLLARHGWEARSRTIPFAPFLAIGALVAIAPQP